MRPDDIWPVDVNGRLPPAAVADGGSCRTTAATDDDDDRGAEDDPPRQVLVAEEDAEQRSRRPGSRTRTSRRVPRGAFASSHDVRGVADDRPERDEVDPRAIEALDGEKPCRVESAERSIRSPPGEHLAGRRRERVAGHPQPRRERPMPTDHISAETKQRTMPAVVAAARRAAAGSPTPAKPTPTAASDRQDEVARPVTQPQDDDPERHRGDDQRGEPDRDVSARRRTAPRSHRAAEARSRCTRRAARRPIRNDPPRRATIAAISAPAVMNRVETANSGAIVSTVIAIAR